MNAKDFFDLVVKMRQAQRKYFKTREKDWLIASKQYEREVDAEIKRIENLEAQKGAVR